MAFSRSVVPCVGIDQWRFLHYMFCHRGVVAAIVSTFSDSYALQVIAFAVVSALSIFFVRPFALKYLNKNKDIRLSNADAIIGRTGKVTEPITPNGYGRVEIDGDSWKAIAVGGVAIAEGTRVSVVSLDSIIITVKTVE